MSPLEKIQFIEAHSVKGENSFCHLPNWFSADLFSSVAIFPSLKVDQSSRKELIINNCHYLYCDFDMLRGAQYNQIFLERTVFNPETYLSFLKPGERGFIYDFNKEEYIYDDCVIDKVNWI